MRQKGSSDVEGGRWGTRDKRRGEAREKKITVKNLKLKREFKLRTKQRKMINKI